MDKLLIDTLKETLQDNLLCFLDGLPDDVLDNVCQLVINTFNEIV